MCQKSVFLTGSKQHGQVKFLFNSHLGVAHPLTPTPSTAFAAIAAESRYLLWFVMQQVIVVFDVRIPVFSVNNRVFCPVLRTAIGEILNQTVQTVTLSSK